MNNLEDILQVICVGLAVATFLSNTGRGIKAIEVCTECLIFLNTKLPKKEFKFFNLVKIAIYKTLCKAYCIVNDYTNATKYFWKLLDIHRECGETANEGIITLALAHMYEKQFKYAEARELYKSATKIMREIGNRNGEAFSCGKFGIMSYCLGRFNSQYKHAATPTKPASHDIFNYSQSFSELKTWNREKQRNIQCDVVFSKVPGASITPTEKSPVCGKVDEQKCKL